jgi:hypothetical protein
VDVVLGLFVPDWVFYFLVPFVVTLLVADWAWRILGWWRQHTRVRERSRQVSLEDVGWGRGAE